MLPTVPIFEYRRRYNSNATLSVRALHDLSTNPRRAWTPADDSLRTAGLRAIHRSLCLDESPRPISQQPSRSTAKEKYLSNRSGGKRARIRANSDERSAITAETTPASALCI